MPLPRSMIGRSTAPIVTPVDAEWLDAFAAAVGGCEGVAHPLFPVCVEWPAVVAAARLDGGALLADERRRGIHLTHDLTIHRAVRAGDTLTTTATVAALEPHARGTLERLRIDTYDTENACVASTVMGSLFLGVATDADPDTTAGAPRRDAAPTASPVATVPLTITADAARIYSEAARIWNPIHTEAAAATAAGLPAPVLHGTCTLAMAVSAALAWSVNDGPRHPRTIRARFAGMVLMPSTIELHIARADARELEFTVHDEHGAAVVRDGSLYF